MPSGAARKARRLSDASIAAVVMLALIVAGAAIWFVPFLTEQRQSIATVAAPPGLFAASEVAVPPHGSACMQAVTVDPNSRLAQFSLRPASPSSHGGPPVRLQLSAPGYRAALSLRGGYPGGIATLAIAPPPRPMIANACFVDEGRAPVLFTGSTEARSVSRSPLRVDGRPASGDIALTFLDSSQQNLIERLGEVFGHASNLTEGLVPVWLVWVLSVLVALGVPAAATLAFYRALAADEATR